MSEEETGEPEDSGGLLLGDPLLKCLDPECQVSNIAGERLHGRVRDLKPGIGDVALDQLSA